MVAYMSTKGFAFLTELPGAWPPGPHQGFCIFKKLKKVTSRYLQKCLDCQSFRGFAPLAPRRASHFSKSDLQILTKMRKFPEHPGLRSLGPHQGLHILAKVTSRYLPKCLDCQSFRGLRPWAPPRALLFQYFFQKVTSRYLPNCLNC